MKKVISFLLVLVMVFTMLPVRAFASETEEGTPTGEPDISDRPASSGEPTTTDDPAAAEPTERVCEDGCILVGEVEHEENGGECFVWISCTLTSGCEGPEGHEGECYGAALYDGTCTVTVSGNSYRGKYVVISDGTTSNVYYISSSGTVQNADGTEASFEPGTYTVYYGTSGNGNSSFAGGSFTVSENVSTVSARLSSAQVNSNTAYATRYLYATSLFYNASSFDHVDVRVAGSYVIHVGSQTYKATVSNPSVVVKVGGTTVASQTWTGTTSYEWRQTDLQLTKASVITVELVLDLTYTDADGKTHVMEDVQITYDSTNNVDKFIEAIAICDMVMGLDFQVSVEDIEEEIQYHAVSYEWRVYNTDGTFTSLPAGAPAAPAGSSGHAAGEQYVYDTGYVTGTSFYDYDSGLLYTFHGWDTYSHSSAYNPVPSSGYYALDDGDTDASNNATIEITADTYIYGYWTVTELEPSSAHIAIEKVFIVDGVEMTLAEAMDLWFRIDTGIDRDGDGDSLIDVDYTMIAASGGEYKIPVYQYDTPFVFTEHNADVPGYTRTTTITVAGDHIVSSTQSGDSVTVIMDPVYQGENIHLGTVTYTNTYTKTVGAPVHEYPELILMKSASDTHLAQDGVVFTLYSDAACTMVVTTVTTANGGLADLNFADIADVTPGTYYLKETTPLAGYHADPCVYAITLTASQPVEELRGGEYVQVTYYTLSVSVPADSTASYQESTGYYRLHIYNEPVLGSLELSKTVTGMADADKSKLNAVVVVHGPITRGADGSITDIGSTWQLSLNSENNWTASLGDLPLGEYLIHESFASVHGYTWTGVTYGDLDTVLYNGITSGIFKIESETAVSLELTNAYEEWTAADFYIKKVDENGVALPGAVFRLSYDAAGENVIATVTTGADGYAYFSGYTVPEGQTSVTYYLREIKAPNGYYLSDQVYQVVITAVTVDGKTTYEPVITLLTGSGSGFDINTDLLTVTNYPVLGSLTITKAFANGTIPEGLTGVFVHIGGPNGYSHTVELNNANGWSVTLEDLVLGEYTVSELNANVPGYTWSVSYSETTVTLTEEDPGYTVQGTVISDAATVTNSYTRNEEFFEIPTSLTVKKVDENAQPLAGAVFTLDRMSADGKTVLNSVSFTTGANGIVVFDLLTGFIDENGTIIEGEYILSETKAPEGYEKIDTTWTITVKEDDGDIRVVLNENKNIFENFWDWIVGTVSPGTWEDGILTVTNRKKTGSLSVTKSVGDPEGIYSGAEYSFTLDCSDDAFDKTFTLKAGETCTVENIPWGTTYTLTEDATGAAFASSVSDAGNGIIWADETAVTVTNTYRYTVHSEPLSLFKGGETYETVTLSADNDWTHTWTGLTDASVWSIDETEVPAGYTKEITVDGYAFVITNTRTIQPVEVSVKKVWVASEGVTHPESVEAVLYRDGEKYDTVVLSEENGWSHVWTGLTDEYTWSVDEVNVPVGYTKNVTADGYDFTITNTREFKNIDVTVKKIWYGADVTHPSSVDVVLYRDGEVYDTVTLSAENNWTHTWTDLTDEFQWTVDEPSVPSGYTKTVRRNGYSFTIVNTHEDIPKTGDFTNLVGMGAMAAAGAVGFGVTAIALLASRKKKEEEE